MKVRFLPLVILVLIVAWMVAGCNTPLPVEVGSPQGGVLGTPSLANTPIQTVTIQTPTALLSATFTITISPLAQFTSTASQTPFPFPDTPLDCGEGWCIFPGHFWLSSPVLQGKINRTYRYGGTQQYQRETHHGVEFIEASGTPVLAAAEGIVIVAGSDLGTNYGLYRNFYGNLVIIEHEIPSWGQKVYTLYGHLSSVGVQIGDLVQCGQRIGNVGSTGAALGSHLHFEVRLGINDYLTTCNPELWLEQDIDAVTGYMNGGLAARIHDGDTSINTHPVLIEYYQDPEGPVSTTLNTETYAWDTPNSDLWQENLAITNLPPGKYRVSFVREDRWFHSIVSISPGQLTLVEFEAE